MNPDDFEREQMKHVGLLPLTVGEAKLLLKLTKMVGYERLQRELSQEELETARDMVKAAEYRTLQYKP